MKIKSRLQTRNPRNQNLEFNRIKRRGSVPAGWGGSRQVRPMSRHAKIEKALDFVSKSKNRQVELADVIARSGMSRRGFFKAFSDHIGITPGQLMKGVRIEKAKRMLVENDLGLAEIAERCGYRSVNSFWVAFRNATGMAPKKFQRQAWFGAYRSKSKKQAALDLLFGKA